MDQIPIRPDENWRKIKQIQDGTLRIEELTLDEIIARYPLTEQEINTLKEYEQRNQR